MNIHNQILLTGALLSASSIALAAENISYDEESGKYVKYVWVGPENLPEDDEDFDPFWEVNIMGGGASLDADGGNISIVGDNREITEVDQLSQSNEDEYDWGTGRIGLGYLFPITDKIDDDELIWFPFLTPQVNLYYLRGDVDGKVYSYGDSKYYDQDYQMDFTSTRLMFDLGLTLAAYEHFSVYTLAGIGISWNMVDFTAEHHDAACDCVITLPATSEDSGGYAWEAGLGFSFAATDYLTLSAEYLYTNFPGVGLGDNTDEPYKTLGSEMDVSAQSLLFGVRIGL